ncbi:choline kinase [Vibrio coralliilyticus]|uniref:aminoglycoside phosphotransferase family protein n=1 Tax=Vibrio coralliilyticus TaxID=190893 RepID=UPI00081090E9|nr:aminoglycoside phosphotransferase family protein [Vibrio coralliilyticus]ANW26882.1 choline kinase [Vibrio coralliilyticus]
MSTSYDYQALSQRLGYTELKGTEVLQSLWSGYGELVRLHVDETSIVIKHVQLPKPSHHPRGWNSDLSHQRKLKSYQVELHWYQRFAQVADSHCPQPKPIVVEQQGTELLLVMEDLHQLGYTQTHQHAAPVQMEASLKWLAWFHASHIGERGDGLWDIGTYWHLDTRPDELEALDDLPLKQAADQIDQVLRQAPYQTLVHGDAKLANFCFTSDGSKAAAVDFQYVGRGCAMKDVALFMSSAVKPEQCDEMESWILDTYFSHLKRALNTLEPDIDANDVEQSWRSLFAIAWADFHRFVKGWSPGHWKINDYTEALAYKALELLKAYP